MSSCYIGDHTAEDHIHIDITKCTTEEPQQKCQLGMSVKDYWGLKTFILYTVFLPFIHLRFICRNGSKGQFHKTTLRSLYLSLTLRLRYNDLKVAGYLSAKDVSVSFAENINKPQNRNWL